MDIILTTINAKWIHPSLALRLLKANLGSLEDRCEIIEFALRQPLAEKIEPFLTLRPKILGISVSIWNHLATIELLEELMKKMMKPIVVLGGPEVSHLPEDAEIFKYADYVIRGEGEVVFRTLCENLLETMPKAAPRASQMPKFINTEDVDINKIKTAYHLYTDEDVSNKLIYVESSRGCPFNCEFCISSVKKHSVHLREFLLPLFFTEMNTLIQRGVKTFKFLDRTFNINNKRAIAIMEFFLEKLEERKTAGLKSFVVHFEMVASIFSPELLETLTRFPPETLRLEIGIQTLNSETAALIKRPSNPEKELEAIRFLCEKTNAIIHADLIAGLPGENLESFGNGFNLLWQVFSDCGATERCEIQLGILKLLPGAPIVRQNESFGMHYSTLPPYEVQSTFAMSVQELDRVKNFARFWEMIVNRGLAQGSVFEKFMELSDSLLKSLGKNWGIDKNILLKAIENVDI